MGMNTAMIVRNDFLHEIRDDPKFGEKVWAAVCADGDEKRMPYAGQSFSILPSCHADYIQIVSIGGNLIKRFGYGGSYRATDDEILRRLARDAGYRLVKLSKPDALSKAGG